MGTRSGSTTREFCECVFDSGLCQVIKFPTHLQGNILDLVFTNHAESIAEIQVWNSHLTINTDHLPNTYSLCVDSIVYKLGSKRNVIFNYLCINYTSLSNF